MKIIPLSFKNKNYYSFYNKQEKEASQQVNQYKTSREAKVSFPNTYLPNFKANLIKHLENGAQYIGNNQTKFTYIAPNLKNLSILLAKGNDIKNAIETKFEKTNDKFTGIIKSAPGDRYILKTEDLEGNTYYTYDPFANYLPNDISSEPIKANRDIRSLGLTNWAEIIDHNKYKWNDSEWMSKRTRNKYEGWHLPKNMISEEIHIGLLGGFQKAKKRIAQIAQDKIVNTIKIMPIGEFFGDKNWGYEESCKFTPENSYGTPDDFKEFVDYAHKNNIRVILDVVPNHFGPYGSNINTFIPAFSKDSNDKNAWGINLNFKNVNEKKYIINYMTDMLMNWGINYHIDGFRMDATHEIIRDYKLYANTISEITYDLRNHEETKDIYLYSEDMRYSRATANANYDKNILDSNLGFDGETSFDYFKTLINLGLNTGIYNTPYNLEILFNRGIYDFHEDLKLQQGETSDRNYYSMISKLKNPSASNYIIAMSNHDEIRNDAGGKRIIPNLIYFNFAKELEEKYQNKILQWDKGTEFIDYILESYFQTGKCPSPQEQQEKFNISFYLSEYKFQEYLNDAYENQKIFIASTLTNPAPKELFMGDEEGEIKPLYLFHIFPEEHNFQEGTENHNSISKENFNKSIPDFTRENIPPTQTKFKNGIKFFAQDIAKLLQETPFKNADYSNIKTFSYNKENILEIKYFSQNAFDNTQEEMVILLNFSNNGYKNFALNTFEKVVPLEEVINSTYTKYNGNGNAEYFNSNETNNLQQTFSNSINIPPKSAIILRNIING